MTSKLVNRKGQADRVVEFVKSSDPLASSIIPQYTVIKEQEKKKYRPASIVSKMKSLGFEKFTMQHHTDLWRSLNAKADSRYGVVVEKYWFWYEEWISVVKSQCEENPHLYMT